MHISWARLASFYLLGFISDPLIVSKFHNETHDPKGQENKIYTIVKGRETFYRRHTVPVTSCSEVKYVLKRVSLGSKDCIKELSLKRLKIFGHLSNQLNKTRMGSHHSEKTEFLRQILRKKPTFVIGNSNQPSHDPDSPSKGASPFSSIGDITVDPKGVAKLLDGLNVHKASGPDGLDARVLKEYSNEISPILALIYNESLARGDAPDEWRQVNVSSVFKKGEKYDAANYRPVSPTCICCKTLEHILVSNINKHLALDSILADCQHGFRSERSCETQLVQFVHDIISNLDGTVNRRQKQTD